MTLEGELVADADEPVAPDDQWYSSETAVDDDGVAHFVVRVEAASWMQIDRVRLLENGVPVQDIDLATWTRCDDLRAGIRFDGALTATPVADAWYVIEVFGSNSMWPFDAGQTPYAMTNPIEVDQDDDVVWPPPAQTNTTRPAAFRQVPPSDALAPSPSLITR